MNQEIFRYRQENFSLNPDPDPSAQIFEIDSSMCGFKRSQDENSGDYTSHIFAAFNLKGHQIPYSMIDSNLKKSRLITTAYGDNQHIIVQEYLVPEFGRIKITHIIKPESISYQELRRQMEEDGILPENYTAPKKHQ